MIISFVAGFFLGWVILSVLHAGSGADDSMEAAVAYRDGYDDGYEECVDKARADGV